MSYFNLIKQHPKYISYGALHYFFSSVGQTFLISVSIPFMLEDIGLTSGEFSTAYAAATIASGLSLPFIGEWVDKAPLKTLSFVAGIGLIVAALTMYTVSSLWILIPGLFLLRFFGQGSMILIGSTAIAKFFSQNRGKALSLSSLGLALAETVIPVIIVAIINQWDWQTSWLILAIAVGVVFLPVSQLLIKGQVTSSQDADNSSNKVADFTRTQVLKDPKFYLILPTYLFLPFFITGMFIHQNMLAAAKGWTMEWMAITFIGYGIAKVATSFLGGSLIDRFSAKKVFIFYLVPLAVGLSLMLFSHHQLIAMAYMILLGASASLASLTGVAMWAELYGTRNLGAIKSMTTTFMVIATAIGPIVLGYGLEQATNMTLLCSMAVIVIIVFSNFWVINNTRNSPNK